MEWKNKYNNKKKLAATEIRLLLVISSEYFLPVVGTSACIPQKYTKSDEKNECWGNILDQSNKTCTDTAEY